MKTKNFEFTFYPVEEKHFVIILDWLNKDHVREYFYGEGLQNTLSNLKLSAQGIHNNGKYSFEHWIAYAGDQPFGFLMTTPVEGPYNPNDPYDKWYEEGKKIITLDVLIGPEEFLGKGLAHRMIIEFLKEKFPDVNKVLIDPDASNARAIHVYEKAGFKKVEQFLQQHDEPKPCWMMIFDLK